MTRPHVLVVGASGVFGSKLSRLLARRQAFRVSLGGRNQSKIVGLQEELLGVDPVGGFEFAMVDRDTISAGQLKQVGCQLVVDCSGPFQEMGTNLIEAAIEAGCHYIDLADSRAFISAISRFDAHAKAAGVSVMVGASSTPGLSNAVLDTMLAGWRSVDSIDCAIFPGNQTPKGQSVIRGILSWVGQPVRVFREGTWQTGSGWTRGRWISMRGLSRRRVMLADVPDLDVLRTRYAPRVRAGFDAGMELPVLNWLIGIAGLPVRWRILRSATVFTGIGSLVANSLDRFGSRDGGMLIEAAGVDAMGEPRRMQWQLKASKGDGPYVPVGPAAALIDKLLLSNGTPIGAGSAAGLLTIEEIKQCYAGLAIEFSEQELPNELSVYRQVLGEDFDSLPEVTRRLHRGRPAIVANGEATVVPSASAVGRFVARCFGMPTAGGRVPVRVVIESRDGREHWTRTFGDKPMRSTMRAEGGLIEEAFGPVVTRMRLVVRPDGLNMERVGASVLGIPLPGFLLPLIKAEERVDAAGHHLFEVDIGAPVFGRIVSYHGHLAV